MIITIDEKYFPCTGDYNRISVAVLYNKYVTGFDAMPAAIEYWKLLQTFDIISPMLGLKAIELAIS